MACNDCNSPIETVPLLPNCTPIPPCTEACEQTINAKCVIYKGDSLSDIGITIANPEMETVVEKLKIAISSITTLTFEPIIKNTDFDIKSYEKIYYLKGDAYGLGGITRKINLPVASTFPLGTTWKFIYQWVENTYWEFNTNITFGLNPSAPQKTIQNLLGITTPPSSLGTVALPSFNLTIINNNGTPTYMVYK